MTKKTRNFNHMGISNVLTTIIILVASIVIGTGVVVYGTGHPEAVIPIPNPPAISTTPQPASFSPPTYSGNIGINYKILDQLSNSVVDKNQTNIDFYSYDGATNEFEPLMVVGKVNDIVIYRITPEMKNTIYVVASTPAKSSYYISPMSTVEQQGNAAWVDFTYTQINKSIQKYWVIKVDIYHSSLSHIGSDDMDDMMRMYIKVFKYGNSQLDARNITVDNVGYGKDKAIFTYVNFTMKNPIPNSATAISGLEIKTTNNLINPISVRIPYIGTINQHQMYIGYGSDHDFYRYFFGGWEQNDSLGNADYIVFQDKTNPDDVTFQVGIQTNFAQKSSYSHISLRFYGIDPTKGIIYESNEVTKTICATECFGN